MREGVGLTITEAMSTGMPVVTTNYPTMNEWFEEGSAGHFIKTRRVTRSYMPTHKAFADSSSLAKIMEEYILHPDKIRDQSREARRLVETHYNWDHRDEQILVLLRG